MEPRRNLLERRIPGGRGSRAIAANLDLVYVMAAAADPAPVPQLLDRLLVLAKANDIPAAVVVNKIDLDPGTALVARMEWAGYEAFPLSVAGGTGLERLFAEMHTRVSLLTGPSGVGKSSLLNLLQPGLRLRTGPISEKVGRGTNVTVTAEMIPLDGGGFLVDPPGFSDVGSGDWIHGSSCTAFPICGDWPGSAGFPTVPTGPSRAAGCGPLWGMRWTPIATPPTSRCGRSW